MSGASVRVAQSRTGAARSLNAISGGQRRGRAVFSSWGIDPGRPVRQHSPMPRQRSAERLSRARIVEVAMHHFHRDGYHKASLNAIARELGVVKGALYYYAPRGKLELLDAVVQDLDDEMYNAMVAAANAEPDPRRALFLAVDAKLAVLAGRRDQFGLRREVMDEVDQVLGQRERDFDRRERTLYEAILARGEATRVFRAIKPRAAAAAAIQIMVRATQMVEIFGVRSQSGEAPSVLAPVFELILRGVETRP